MVSGNPGAKMALWLSTRRGAGFDPPVIAVSVGPNDIIACNGRVDCAADDIRGFMDTACADHEVWWAMQTAAIADNQAAWNEALQIVAAERPNLTLWDWPAIQQSSGIVLAPDHTHLPGAAQYRDRSTLIAADVTDRMAGSRHSGNEVAPPVAGESYEYKPGAPQLVVDTRTSGQRLGAGATLNVDLCV